MMGLGNDSGILGGVSLVVALLSVVLVFVTNRHANKRKDRKLTLEEQAEDDKRDDLIAERRLVELERLYKQIPELQDRVAELEASDRVKQRTIDDQADELERTNEALSDVRDVFSRFVARVEKAWEAGHPMPKLTDDEQVLLEKTIPRRLRVAKEK